MVRRALAAARPLAAGIDDIIRELQPEAMITGDRLHSARAVPRQPLRGATAPATSPPASAASGSTVRAVGGLRRQSASLVGLREARSSLQERDELVYLLAEALGQGANLLLNFGPMGCGAFRSAPRAAEGLGRFSPGAMPGDLRLLRRERSLRVSFGDMTQRGETLYLWVK